MTTPHITPVAEPDALARASASSLTAASAIVEQLLPTLDRRARQGIDTALSNGGTLCIESSVDVVHAPRVALTVVTAEGKRFELAAVHVPDAPTTGAR